MQLPYHNARTELLSPGIILWACRPPDSSSWTCAFLGAYPPSRPNLSVLNAVPKRFLCFLDRSDVIDEFLIHRTAPTIN